jgi:ElaB/YqjD/DUF883 family membrane-anchored ribosome-binding protein
MDHEKSIMKTLSTAKDQAIESVDQVTAASIAKAREIVCDADQHVRQNPWPYIAGSAVIGALLGYLLGRSRK